MKKLKLAYFGAAYFSARFLKKLITDTTINQLIEIKLVVTQPDRPVGRKQILTQSPVKQIAKKFQFPISKQISNFKLLKIDLALLYAYGEIIPKELLSIPKYGFLNIHPSLLPKYRGASPITYPLILGDKKTGVTIIKMDEKLDHGPIIVQEQMPILPQDRRPDLEIKLMDLAFVIFKKTVFNKDSLQIKPQDHQKATYTRLLKKDDGFIPLTTLKKALNNEPITFEELPKILQEIRNLKLEIRNSPKIIYDYFRGLYPWPGLWTILSNGKRLKITDMKLSNFKNFPTLKLEKVQLEGKKEVALEQFNQVYKVF